VQQNSQPKKHSGLKACAKLVMIIQAKLTVLFLGKHKEYHGHVTAIPFQEALETLPTLLS